jgi:uncharacterized protein (DUF58 family)
MNWLKELFLTSRFFVGMSLLILALVFSFPFPFLMPLAKAACVLYALVVVIDVIILFNRGVRIEVERKTPPLFSLGDSNAVTVTCLNRSTINFQAELIDELPEQFQIRDFSLKTQLPPNQLQTLNYTVRPTTRGEYVFGDCNLFIQSALGLVRRRIIAKQEIAVPVYPSIIQMKKYEIRMFARSAAEQGIKKVRRIGHSYEFEQIKQYMRGDDFRSINWKATGRRAQLMVNQYEDERSQQVYCVIDKSRVMHMPFNGLSLFDYAVNSALVMSNIALGKQDRAGLITFAESPKAFVKAERSRLQLKKIIETLYREKEGSVESNYENLYASIRQFINGRCLLFLYTNFESIYALHRVLPQLRKLSDQHLLVVVFFENTEISTAHKQAQTMEDIYRHAVAENYVLSKVQLVQELNQFGINSILTKPENLTVSTINKYLELKSRGLI